MTLTINDIEHNDTQQTSNAFYCAECRGFLNVMLSVVMLSVVVLSVVVLNVIMLIVVMCHYADRYDECRGALQYFAWRNE